MRKTNCLTFPIVAAAFGLMPALAAGGALTERPCLRGNEPAATLLFPYFEVDLSQPWDGRTTLIAVTNVEADPVLTRAVIWSNWGAPVLAFDIYLAGHDVQTVNLRDVLAGNLPATGAATSPHGPTSAPPIQFPGCNAENVAWPQMDVEFVRKALTGQSVAGGCWGEAVEESLALGYITLDVVTRCDERTPVDEGYFATDGSGVAGYANTLMGDWFMVHPGQDFAQGMPAAHMAADRDHFEPGDKTFYRTFVGADGSDARVPLSGSWGVRYAFGGAFSAGTRFILWRELSEAPISPRSCDLVGSPWVESPGDSIVVWDEDSQSFGDEPVGEYPGKPEGFGYLATEAWTQEMFPSPFGWLRVTLPTSRSNSPEQGWLGMVMSAEGRYSVGVPGTPQIDPCTGT